MRLLNIETMKMEEFFDETVPEYAILSHRWGREEISLQEWNRVEEITAKIQAITSHNAFEAARHENDYYHESLRDQHRQSEEEKSEIKRKSGFSKIVSCAEVARKQKIHKKSVTYSCNHVWIDTCCINKTSNAELSEAINSMFRWYHNSLVCIVYLADVSTNLLQHEMEDKVRTSNWFERGWTLQELLAPDLVMFFDRSWVVLFDRGERAQLIEDITHIDKNILQGFEPLTRTCTAKKMSWVATRKTTRKEDLAYCLLGIFEVNMPLLYGEGEKAFERLQEEIIRQSGDLSIFAWGYNTPMGSETSYGILAPSPASFIGCSNFIRKDIPPAVMSMTNVTLSVRLHYHRPLSEQCPGFIYADLGCFEKANTLIVFPLVVKKDQWTVWSGDRPITSAWFERRAGARPIDISDTNEGFRDGWTQESHTLSIFKKQLAAPDLSPDIIFFQDLNHSSSPLMVHEVYPPHFWGRNPAVLDFGGDPERRFRYPGAIKKEKNTYPDEFDPVAYVRISRWSNKSSQIVLKVRCNELYGFRSPDQRYFEVRLVEWPACDRLSLADVELRNVLPGFDTRGISTFELGVDGNQLGDFVVNHSRRYITIGTKEYGVL